MISLTSGFYVFKVSEPNICLNIDSISIRALMSCVVFTDVPFGAGAAAVQEVEQGICYLEY